MTTQAPLKTLVILASSLFLTGVSKSQNASVIEIENVVQTSAGSKGEWVKARQNQTLAIGDRRHVIRQ